MDSYSELFDLLSKFRDYTIELIKIVEEEEFELLEEKLLQRQKLIDRTKKLNYNQGQFTTICNELKIIVLIQRLDELMQLKKTKLRVEIESFVNAKNANKSYTKSTSLDSLYFNKKI